MNIYIWHVPIEPKLIENQLFCMISRLQNIPSIHIHVLNVKYSIVAIIVV